MLLRQHPELIDELFAGDDDRRTAEFAAASCPGRTSSGRWTRFFLMQPLIEAALDNWKHVRRVLTQFGLKATTILEAMTTPMRAQRIAADGRSLLGDNRIVLTQRPGLGRPPDRRAIRHSAGRAATGCSTPATISRLPPMASVSPSPTIRSVRTGSRRSRCCAQPASGSRRVTRRSRRAWMGSRSSSSTPSIPGLVATTPSVRF